LKIYLRLSDAENFAEAVHNAAMSYNYEDCPAPPERVAELLNCQFGTDIFSSDGINGKMAGVKIRWPRDRIVRKPIKTALKIGIELDVQPVKTYLIVW
jgi:hypothetical protein